jgi:hypothetical protein
MFNLFCYVASCVTAPDYAFILLQNPIFFKKKEQSIIIDKHMKTR